MRHPWQVTFRQFIAHASRERDVHLGQIPAADGVIGFLVSEELGREVAVYIDLDEVLSEITLRSLCNVFGIPPDDFQLDPTQDD